MNFIGLIKKLCRFIFPDPVLGFIDYYRFPERMDTWGGLFNGQESRKEIFTDIMGRAQPVAIIETGTNLGDTTAYFASMEVPVISIEAVARTYGYARIRLRNFGNVSLCIGDSRKKLRELFEGVLKEKANRSLFFYLDAHWHEDLPLREEVEIIFANAPLAIVMVDDFKVPDDAGYTYDDYGGGNTLDADYLAASIKKYNLVTYFPKKSSEKETGMKRGCVVLCQAGPRDVLNAIRSLRNYPL